MAKDDTGSARRGKMNWHGTLRLAFVVSLAIPLGLPLGNCGICTDIPETETPTWETTILSPNRHYNGNSVAEGEEGDLYVAGDSYSGETDGAALVMRRTESGGPRWMRDTGIAGESVREARVAAAAGGGVVVFAHTGYSYDPSGASDYVVVRLDGLGNTLWDKRFGGARAEFAVDVIALEDGYMLLGTTNSTGSGGTDMELIQTDAEGEVLWTRTYGGAANDGAADLERTADGGFVIFGETESLGSGELDYYMVKTDAGGEEQWYETYGYTNFNDAGGLCQTEDGGYLLAGSVGNVYVVKTDAQGGRMWERVLGADSYYVVSGVAPAEGGGFVITGSETMFSEEFYFCAAAFVMETGGDGALIRSRLFGELTQADSEQIIPTRDGAFVLVGTAFDFGGGPSGESRSAVYLAKVNTGGTQP